VGKNNTSVDRQTEKMRWGTGSIGHAKTGRWVWGNKRNWTDEMSEFLARQWSSEFLHFRDETVLSWDCGVGR
jgi:hypothetical protein